MSLFKKITSPIISILFKLKDYLGKFSPARYLRRRKILNLKKTKRSCVIFLPQIGCRIVLEPEMFISEVYILGSYEPHLVCYLKRILKKGMICIDIGAYIGYFSLLMAKLVGPEGKVISFEPTTLACNLLRENAKLNGLNNILIEESALYNYNGRLDFHYLPKGYEVYNTAGRPTHPCARNIEFTTGDVRCVSLDAYLNEKEIKKVDIIKIDTEGAELFVLKGMPNILNSNPQAIIIIELDELTTQGFGYAAKDLANCLRAGGYRLSIINSCGGLTPIKADQRWRGQMVVAKQAG